MKSLIMMLLLLTVLIACDGPPKAICVSKTECYRMRTMNVIPDSSVGKVEKYVKEITQAASYHMSTADYEHPQNLIAEALNQAKILYGVPTTGLMVVPCSNCGGWGGDPFIPYNKLNNQQKSIYDSLLEGAYKRDRPPQSNN